MKFLKNQKFQIGALLVLLVAVIVAGSCWFLRPQGQEDDAPPPETSDVEPEGSTFVAGDIAAFSSNLEPRPYSIVREEAAEAELSCYGITGEIFYYRGQVCYFRAVNADELTIEVVSMLSGETLRAYTSADFFDNDTSFISLYMDYDGILWALYELDRDPTQIRIVPCKSGITEEDVQTFDLSEELAEPYSPTTFAVWENYVVIHSGTHADDTYYYTNQMLVINTDSGQIETKFNHIWRFCLDESGNLYYLTDGDGDEYYQNGDRYVSNAQTHGYPDNYEVVAKYSLQTAEQLWAVGGYELPMIFPRGLSYSPEGGLFLAGTDRGPGGVFYWIDIEDGQPMKEAADFLLDVEDPPEDILAPYQSTFAVDGQYRIYVLRYDIAFDDETSDTRFCSQKQFVLEPEIDEAPSEGKIILSITAPYRLDTIDSALKIYRRYHPNVSIIWDVDYASGEEFSKNEAEYKERFALRAMTGDLGDIVMLGGTDLSLDIVTGTDAFADLSGYLEESTDKEELLWNLVETMRGEDGTIRGIPVGVIPNYLIWNEELLQEYNIDPYTVTWSQLLDLALQWQEEGTDLSLATTTTGTQSYVRALILRDILLANLQGSTAKLDTPELRDVLTKFQALLSSKQLIRSGESDKALFSRIDMTQHNIDKVYNLGKFAEAGEFTPFAGPFPLGEGTELRQGYAYCWGISGNSQQKDAAWGFLESLISSKGLHLYTYENHLLSINTAAQENWIRPWASDFESWGIGEFYETYFHQIQETMTVPYARLDEPDVFESVYDLILQYCKDELSLDQALREAETSWERYLEE